MSERAKVGGNVDAYCSRCKMELAHTVVAMVDGRVVRTKCNTCHSFHRYRAPPSEKKSTGGPSRARRPKKSGGKKATAAAMSWEVQWKQQIDQSKQNVILPYRMSDTFGQGDVIQHKRFGLGVVQQVIDSQKMTALFRSGMRTLVMNR